MGGNQGKLRKQIKSGDVEAVRQILDAAGDGAMEIINEQFNITGNPLEFAPVFYNALQYAVTTNNLDIVELLLQRGADVHCRRNGGETLLHVAVHKGNIPLIDILRKNGIDMFALDEQGQAVLHRACHSYTDPSTLIEYLLEHGRKEDVNFRDFKGLTPLHHAAFGSNFGAATTLLENGADVNASDELGRTPYHAAKKQLKMQKLLVEHGADSNVPDPLYHG